jgi:hypothetical protein
VQPTFGTAAYVFCRPASEKRAGADLSGSGRTKIEDGLRISKPAEARALVPGGFGSFPSGVTNLAKVASLVGTPDFLATPCAFEAVLCVVARAVTERRAPDHPRTRKRASVNFGSLPTSVSCFSGIDSSDENYALGPGA